MRCAHCGDLPAVNPDTFEVSDLCPACERVRAALPPAVFKAAVPNAKAGKVSQHAAIYDRCATTIPQDDD